MANFGERGEWSPTGQNPVNFVTWSRAVQYGRGGRGSCGARPMRLHQRRGRRWEAGLPNTGTAQRWRGNICHRGEKQYLLFWNQALLFYSINISTYELILVWLLLNTKLHWKNIYEFSHPKITSAGLIKVRLFTPSFDHYSFSRYCTAMARQYLRPRGKTIPIRSLKKIIKKKVPAIEGKKFSFFLYFLIIDRFDLSSHYISYWKPYIKPSFLNVWSRINMEIISSLLLRLEKQ